MRWPRACLAASFLLCSSAVGAAALQVGAPDLLASAEQSYGQTLAAAQHAGARLAPTNPRFTPFWSSLNQIGGVLETARATLAARDPQFFEILRSGSRSLAELRVIWNGLGVNAPEVEASLAGFASSYRLLRSGFGREGFREQQEAPLSSEEQRRLAQWQDSQRRLAEQLRALSELAASRGDTDTVSRLAPLLADAERIADEEPTLDSYLEASLANDTQQGEWDALSPQLAESYAGEWQSADSIMEELSVESDVGFVRAANLGKIAAYLDQKGEIVEHEIVKAGAPAGAKPLADDAKTRAGADELAEKESPTTSPEEAALRVPAPSLPAWHFDPNLPSYRFRLFLTAEAPAAFRLWSGSQLAQPAAYWLELAASRPAAVAAPVDRRGR